MYLANRRPVYRLIMQHDLLRGLTQRYVAGEELADGIVVAQTLNTQGLLVSLDHLGESVTNGAEARRATAAYLDALEAIAEEQCEASISLKLTQLGLDLSHEMCVAHLRKILERARQLDTFVRFDMLFGVRRDLQLRLVREGYRVRVYLPYGKEWYPYLVRRLAERPANIGFFVRSLVTEALAGRRNGRP